MTTSARLSLPAAHGLSLAADAYGPADAPPVLLLHGGGQTRHAWGGTAAVLAAHGYRAIAIDARGHGESDWDPERRYLLDAYVEDLVHIAESFGRPPAVVGASLGGLTGLVAAGGRGLALPALVLVDIAPQIERAGVARIYEFMSGHPDGFATLEEVADAVAAYLPHRERPRDTRGLEKNLRRGEDGRWRWRWDPAFLDVMFERRPDEDRDTTRLAATRLDVPTLLVRGRLSDLLTEEGARAFLELAPHAEYVDVSGAAHMVAGDRNDRFTGAVVDFLTRAYPPT